MFFGIKLSSDLSNIIQYLIIIIFQLMLRGDLPSSPYNPDRFVDFLHMFTCSSSIVQIIFYCWSFKIKIIRITFPCNVDPLIPHFYIVKHYLKFLL